MTDVDTKLPSSAVEPRIYSVLVTYAVSIEGHDSYCSGNEDVDWVKLDLVHDYHDLECMSICTLTSINNQTKNITCPGRLDITNSLYEDRTEPSGSISRLVWPISKLCNPVNDTKITKYEDLLDKKGKKTTLPKSLEISEFIVSEDYSINITDDELEHIVRELGHCRAEVVSVNREPLIVPDNYESIGQITDKSRLHDLYFYFNHGTDECLSGYCDGGQGSYYVPIRALLLKHQTN